MENIPTCENGEAIGHRKKCLLALAVAMGADEAEAREKIEWMFQMAEELGEIDFSRGLDECDEETERKIRRIGSILSANRDTQQYAIGVRALKLMRDPLDGKSFPICAKRWHDGCLARVRKNSIK